MWMRAALRVLSVAAAIACAVIFPEQPGARMQPYYVVRADAGAAVGIPRIMFILDTSNSMAAQTNAAGQTCAWSECETATDGSQSRVKAARDAIRAVAIEAKNAADFGLMTFDSLPPPSSKGSVPKMCTTTTGRGRSAKTVSTRFRWTEQYTDEDGNTFNVDTPSGGVWELCGDNRPYPYLRWDDLGEGSVVTANGQALADSPLIDTSRPKYDSATNAARKVQWFPSYLGSKAQLNSTTDPNGDILAETYGDYASGDVWEQDFYYWPYVDGFTGYSAWNSPDGTPLGVAEPDTSSRSARIHAPFYLRSAIANFKGADRGPESPEESFAALMDFTSPITGGGFDTGGDTPWTNVIGPIPAAPPQSNSVWSHTTVSSYLKYTRNLTSDDLCTSTVAVLITDGDPVDTKSSSKLHGRLSDLRQELSVKTYVVGFIHASNAINNMACASAGSDNTVTPCTGTPVNGWDTCNDPSDPEGNCVFLADSADGLAEVLSAIVAREIGQEMPAGPSTTLNDFGLGTSGSDVAQTTVSSFTEFPEWKGHVTRSLCDTPDPDDPTKTAEWCESADPTDEMTGHETFGPCPAAWEWDAGVCLQQTSWLDRRLYTHDASNSLVRVVTATGSATTDFKKLASAETGINLSTDQADAFAAFIQGYDWPEGWKLSGLGNSSPLVVRRVPEADRSRVPAVGIRDPHCAGRLTKTTDQVSEELIQFSEAAWTETPASGSVGKHYQYQEAVLVGDDLGVLHAFHLHSGNELFGFVPRMLLSKMYDQFLLGTDNMAQPKDIDDHYYGVSATVNDGWVYDSANKKWRHLAVFGLGRGGIDFVALDISHMGLVTSDQPVEVLWTTEDASLKANYDLYLGETWSRPAITYSVVKDNPSANPTTRLVFGSAYQTYATPNPAYPQGRRVWLVDALTGVPEDYADIPQPRAGAYEENFGVVADIAVGTHCESKFWGESEETYILDPTGRIFRWDLGHLDDPERNHEADSGGKWSKTPSGEAIPLATFNACQDDGRGTCAVGSKPENFVYSPALVLVNRMDSKERAALSIEEGDKDQFVLAFVSGSTNDDAVNDQSSDFHSSIYLMADDHRSDPSGGVTIPNSGGITAPGDHASFMRVPLTLIERERCITYPTDSDSDPPTCVTAPFSKDTRPLTPPRIVVRAGQDADGNVNAEIEVIYVTVTVYEPGEQETCDVRWYDEDTDSFVPDVGATFDIQFRLTLRDGQAIDFVNGSGESFATADDFGFTGPGLSGPIVRQVTDPGGSGSNSGRVVSSLDAGEPCDPNQTGELQLGKNSMMIGGWSVVNGFTPTEGAATP